MARGQSASLDRRKLFSDPVMMGTIVLLIVFLTVFILYPLAVLLVDSVYSDGKGLTFDFFVASFQKASFRTAISNTLKVGALVGFLSTAIGLLFAPEKGENQRAKIKEALEKRGIKLDKESFEKLVDEIKGLGRKKEVVPAEDFDAE